MKKIIRSSGFFVVANLFLLLVAANTHSATNVYRCKTPEGGVIFQQKACSDKQISGDSQQHKMWRTLRGMTADGIRILSDLGADVESIKACKVKVDAYKLRLDALEPQMAKLTYTHPNLLKSYRYLYECAVCKTSAESFCHSSNASLDQAMKNLIDK